jgi:hypothetical protein
MRHEYSSLSAYVTGAMIPMRQIRVLEKSPRDNRQDAKIAKKKPRENVGRENENQHFEILLAVLAPWRLTGLF